MRSSGWTRAGGALLVVLVMAGGCAGPSRRGRAGLWHEEGLASWYGKDFHGRRTASGERYNMYAMTAAHRTLPLGTLVTVTHRETGRRVVVRINDRGPFVAGRIIDLSYGAARKLGSAESGVAPVIIEAAVRGRADAPPPPPGSFSVQVGAFASPANAARLRNELGAEFGEVRVETFEDNRGLWHRVRAGRFPTEAEADRAARNLAERGLPAFVVRED